MPYEVKPTVGFNSCSDRMAILKNETVPRELSGLPTLSTEPSSNDFLYVDNNGDGKKILLSEVMNNDSMKSDWDALPSQVGYIKNKPGVDNLESELIAQRTVGGVKAGHKFAKGTSVREILDMILGLDSSGYIVKFCTSSNPALISDIDFKTEDVEENRVDLTMNELALGVSVSVSPEDEYFVILVPKVSSGSQTIVSRIAQAGFNLSYSSRETASYLVYYYGPAYTENEFVLDISFSDETE